MRGAGAIMTLEEKRVELKRDILEPPPRVSDRKLEPPITG